jgi:hypothetical protein
LSRIFMSGPSQAHGFLIEDIMMGEILHQAKINGVLPITRSHTERFDAPGYQDPYGRGAPTSVKTSKRKKNGDAIICLADAQRITDMSNEPEMRLMVVIYDQVKDKKVFSEVREYLLRADEWRRLTGDTPKDVLKDFSKAIKLSDPVKARKVAKEWKAHLAAEFPAILRWNPKIDSKNQRRVQCSVLASEVENVIKDKRRIRVFGHAADAASRPSYLRPVSTRLWGVGIELPYEISSPSRPRKAKAAPSLIPTPLQSAPGLPTPKPPRP